MAELYSLPNGWEWKKLDDITELITKGTTPTTNGYKFQNSGINFLKIENIVNGEIDLSTIEMFISEEAHQSQKRSQLQENDVLFSIAGTIGDTAIVKKEHLPMNINQAIALIRPKNILNTFFLKYSLLSIISQNTKDKQRGGAIKNISLGDIKDLNYPLPPLEEQKRIVAKLDILFAKIDKVIALHQKNIDEADIFMESVLNDIFVELNGVYQKRQLDSFDKKMSSGGTPSRKEKLYWDNGTIDWFSSGELNQLYTLPSKEKITQLGLEKTSTKLFSKGTLLIGMYDTAAMKMSILSNDGSCNQAIVGFKSDESELNILFLKYQLEYLKKDILEQRQGVRQQNLNLSKIKNIEIEYPPLKTQQKVVSYLDEISNKMEKIKQIQKEKMQSLKALKASILDQAFKGEL